MGKLPIKYKKSNIYLKVCNYLDNNRLAILLELKNGDYYSDLTINLPDLIISNNNEAFLSADCPEELIDLLKDKKIIDSSQGYFQYNYGRYELVSFNFDVLKKYDFEGISSALEENIQIDEPHVTSVSI